MEKNIHFKLNGKDVRLTSSPERMLLWVLRSDLEHTGTKYSCGEGFCGACTVLVNNEAVLSCQYSIQDVSGTSTERQPDRLWNLERELCDLQTQFFSTVRLQNLQAPNFFLLTA